MKKIPEFSPEEAKEAILACVDCGVAKLAMLEPFTLARLGVEIKDKDKRYVTTQGILGLIPELSPVVTPIVDNELNDVEFSVTGRNLTAANKQTSYSSHVDPDVRFGISALVPLTPVEAIFAAGNNSFMLNRSIFDAGSGASTTEYVGTYTAGELILVRQEIQTLNGNTVYKPQLHHAGAADVERKMVAADFSTPNLYI